MAAPKVMYFCSNCGANSAKWVGKCPSCNEWNTYSEEIVHKEKKTKVWSNDSSRTAAKAQRFSELDSKTEKRKKTGDSELDRVLGGGVVSGSLILLGGEPGIGKSTLLLQFAIGLGEDVLYISGEESEEQLKMRADRIGPESDECRVLTETSLDKIISECNRLKAKYLIIDSIQTVHSPLLDSAPGSVSQIRECAAEFLRLSKETGVSVFLIGHITKEGAIAGPKILEHMVDTVLSFEGDRHYVHRILRVSKNRFGPASELGIYKMNSKGLEPVLNPSEVLITQRDQELSGISITGSIEGMRPLLIETQALVSTAVYSSPQRTATGFDVRRLNMLLAVLEKRCGFRLGTQDVFVNIAGGIRIEDPGMDLGIVASILSSYENRSLPPKAVFAGEVGLSGEVRAVQRIEQRILEAEKLGFTEIYLSKYNKNLDVSKFKIKVHLVGKIDEMFSMLFG
jgi:DNA repair protein RadA/Sms